MNFTTSRANLLPSQKSIWNLPPPKTQLLTSTFPSPTELPEWVTNYHRSRSWLTRRMTHSLLEDLYKPWRPLETFLLTEKLTRKRKSVDTLRVLKFITKNSECTESQETTSLLELAFWLEPNLLLQRVDCPLPRDQLTSQRLTHQDFCQAKLWIFLEMEWNFQEFSLQDRVRLIPPSTTWVVSTLVRAMTIDRKTTNTSVTIWLLEDTSQHQATEILTRFQSQILWTTVQSHRR